MDSGTLVLSEPLVFGVCLAVGLVHYWNAWLILTKHEFLKPPRAFEQVKLPGDVTVRLHDVFDVVCHLFLRLTMCSLVTGQFWVRRDALLLYVLATAAVESYFTWGYKVLKSMSKSQQLHNILALMGPIGPEIYYRRGAPLKTCRTNWIATACYVFLEAAAPMMLGFPYFGCLLRPGSCTTLRTVKLVAFFAYHILYIAGALKAMGAKSMFLFHATHCSNIVGAVLWTSWVWGGR